MCVRGGGGCVRDCTLACVRACTLVCVRACVRACVHVGVRACVPTSTRPPARQPGPCNPSLFPDAPPYGEMKLNSIYYALGENSFMKEVVASRVRAPFDSAEGGRALPGCISHVICWGGQLHEGGVCLEGEPPRLCFWGGEGGIVWPLGPGRGRGQLCEGGGRLEGELSGWQRCGRPGPAVALP